MNDASLIQLKTLVERAVRPVRAGDHRKKRLRDELLGHLVATFNEESGKSGDEMAALRATAARFGDPVELTAELQASVCSGDRIWQFMDRVWSRPGESWWIRAIRQALLIDLLLPILPLMAWLIAGAPAKSSPADVVSGLGFALVPFLLAAFGFTFLAEWMRRAMYRPRGMSWPIILLVAAFCAAPLIAYTLWFDRGDLVDLLLAIAFGLLWIPVSLALLARMAQQRMQHQLEWAEIAI